MFVTPGIEVDPFTPLKSKIFKYALFALTMINGKFLIFQTPILPKSGIGFNQKFRDTCLDEEKKHSF